MGWVTVTMDLVDNKTKNRLDLSKENRHQHNPKRSVLVYII